MKKIILILFLLSYTNWGQQIPIQGKSRIRGPENIDQVVLDYMQDVKANAAFLTIT